MGIATEHSPAAYGGMSAYTCWEIDLRMFTATMEEIDTFTCRQDLWVDAEQFAVRLTRKGDSEHAPYEDRGAVTNGSTIAGRSGFGGTLTGQMLKNNGVFLDGKVGSADTMLVATQTGPDHFRCFRRFDVHEPISLWGDVRHAGLLLCHHGRSAHQPGGRAASRAAPAASELIRRLPLCSATTAAAGILT